MYVSITCIRHPLIKLITYESNRQHWMLAFHQENIVLQKNNCQGTFPTNMLSYLVNIYNFCAWSIYGWYRRHAM